MRVAERSSRAGAAAPVGQLTSSEKRKLLAWFDSHGRPLPWRRDRDPYRIWLSEVMLQQTTVSAVTPRFERFLAKFPTIAAVAAADEQDILKEWEGLGYYRRARNLWRAARILVDEHGASVPNDERAFARLPGVGRYILGAVMSQAFDRPLPVVETNTVRVLCRLFGQTSDPSSPAVRKWLWNTALVILPRRRAGDFNQALMELGAVVCTPKSPKCNRCPLRRGCVARKTGSQHSIPRPAAKPPVVAVRETCVVFRHHDRVLLTRRPSGGRWSNMWEFPRIVLGENEVHESGARRLMKSFGWKARLLGELLTIRYSVTRFRMTMLCLEARTQVAAFRSDYYEEGRWVSPGELSEYPVSSPQRKLAAVLQQPAQPRLF